MRFAYADPPYPGQSKRLYGEHPDFGGEIDHAELLRELEAYDAWALHTSASALHEVLPLCPKPEPSRKNKGRYLQGTGTRILAWVKPQGPWRPVSIQWEWEPVLICGGRDRGHRGHLRDWISCNPRNAGDIIGAKPRALCEYVFEALGLEPDDELVDLFPGSGAVSNAWEAWRSQLRLCREGAA